MTRERASQKDGSGLSVHVLRHLNLSVRESLSLRRLFSENALKTLAESAKTMASEERGQAPSELELKPVLPVKGQGTVRIKMPVATPFRLIVHRTRGRVDPSEKALVLEVGRDKVCFRHQNDDGPHSLIKETTDEKALLSSGEGHHYWFSIDKKNRRLMYGRGYPERSLMLLSADLPAMPEPGSKEDDAFSWMEELEHISIQAALSAGEAADLEARVWPQPVTTDLSPRLISSEAITLDDIDSGAFTVVEDLGPECERLYRNVAGTGIRLSPKFIDALRASLADPERMCAKQLQKKANEFGKPNVNATYLRITLGQDRGNSPGVPFVVEIWPGGHFSPIHSHSGAFAIIKVLHGSLVSRYFEELNVDTTKPYQEVMLEKGDITWLSPEFYQTHQLYNPGTEVCVTIQCYAYGSSDHQHYEFFDYIHEGEKDSRIAHFLPSKDWGFGDFQKKLFEEYDRLGPYPKREDSGA